MRISRFIGALTILGPIALALPTTQAIRAIEKRVDEDSMPPERPPPPVIPIVEPEPIINAAPAAVAAESENSIIPILSADETDQAFVTLLLTQIKYELFRNQLQQSPHMAKAYTKAELDAADIFYNQLKQATQLAVAGREDGVEWMETAVALINNPDFKGNEAAADVYRAKYLQTGPFPEEVVTPAPRYYISPFKDTTAIDAEIVNNLAAEYEKESSSSVAALEQEVMNAGSSLEKGGRVALEALEEVASHNL